MGVATPVLRAPNSTYPATYPSPFSSQGLWASSFCLAKGLPPSYAPALTWVC